MSLAIMGKRRILVADYETKIAETLGMILRMEGYDVRCACEQAGFEFELAAHKPDLIIADVFGFYDAFHGKRSVRTRLPAIKILLLCTQGPRTDLVPLGDALLAKPVPPRLLLRCVTWLLSGGSGPQPE